MDREGAEVVSVGYYGINNGLKMYRFAVSWTVVVTILSRDEPWKGEQRDVLYVGKPQPSQL